MLRPAAAIRRPTAHPTGIEATDPGRRPPTARYWPPIGSMWADLVTAAETSDYQSPLLPEHATGDALTLLVQGLARDQLHDIVTRGVTVHHPEVTSLSPAGRSRPGPPSPTASTTAQWIEYTTSGKRAKNAPGGRRTTTADLTKIGGTWKVSELTVEATAPAEHGLGDRNRADPAGRELYDSSAAGVDRPNSGGPPRAGR